MRVPIMTHEVQVTSGNISGALSLKVPIGAKPESGPAYGAWAAQVAEGVADVVAEWQQRKVSWFTTVYVKKELGPIYTVIYNQAAALLTGSGAVHPQVLAAMDVVRKTIQDYRAGVFGGTGPCGPSHLRAIDLQEIGRAHV